MGLFQVEGFVQAASGSALIDGTTTAGVQPLGLTGWTLKMSEEFAGAVTVTDTPNGLLKFRSNGMTWKAWYPTGTGDGGNDHSNNPGREIEYYDTSQVSVAGGSLVLTAVNDNAHSGIGLPYTSGMVQTNPSYNFTYGFVEARLRCSGAGGSWPAFWMVPADYTWPPEIDIMEQFGTNGLGKSTTWLNTGGGNIGSLNLVSSGVNVVSGYATFGLRWTSTTLTFYVNGTQYAQETNVNAVPQKAMYVVFNLAVESSGLVAGSYPTTFLVDYVRVWQ